MKKTIAALLAGILFIPLTLAGCSTQENGSSGATATSTPSLSATAMQENNLPKITYVVSTASSATVRMYVLTADYTVKEYLMKGTEFFGNYDFFAGELPPEHRYELTEYTISEEDWNALMNTINENNFAELPEKLPDGGVYDGASTYMQVETVDGVHKTGGYAPADGGSDESKRYRAIRDKFYEIIEANRPA